MRAKNLPLISEEVVKTTADILGPHCAAAQALKDAERRRAAGETVEFCKADHSIVVRGAGQLTLRDRTAYMLSGNKKLGRHLLTSAGQDKEAINVECPFCGATVGNRCTGVVFPQYPHTARIESALGLESGAWESMPIDAFEEMQG